MPEKKPTRLRRFVKGTVKPFVDVPAWTGYQQLVASTKSLWTTVKVLFIPQKPAGTETFEQAMERMKLTEKDIEVRQKEFKRLIMVYLTIAAALIVYTFYLIWAGSVHGFIACFAISLVAFAQAFRSHFWLFQMKERKLGCTFQEWLNAGFLSKNK